MSVLLHDIIDRSQRRLESPSTANQLLIRTFNFLSGHNHPSSIDDRRLCIALILLSTQPARLVHSMSDLLHRQCIVLLLCWLANMEYMCEFPGAVAMREFVKKQLELVVRNEMMSLLRVNSEKCSTRDLVFQFQLLLLLLACARARISSSLSFLETFIAD